MPPHCDSLDGPVVTAAREALTRGDVDLVLPYVHSEGEAEVRAAFDLALPARETAPDVADRYFFETVVRVHRAGEGAAFTGLKPAGLDVGPAIPLAEQAVRAGDEQAISDFLAGTLAERLSARMARLRELDASRDGSVVAEREYVEAMLDFEVFSHRVYQAVTAQKVH